MPHNPETSPLTIQRLSLYLRCLRRLQEEGVERISSKEMAERFRLSAAQIRKDLAQFGEFGIRGIGYEVDSLADHLNSLLGLDRRHAMVIVGMGNLGRALGRYWGFNHGSFQVVAGVDNDPAKVGMKVGTFRVRHTSDLKKIVRSTRAEIGILTVPAQVAQQNYDALAAAGIRSVLNFAPSRVETRPNVPLKDVELRIFLEEMAFFLR